MDADFDVIVIGAGVIGLAIAQAIALTGQSVLIIERADHFGGEISSRNSEVIHAGIYYPSGSLKARLCVSGRSMLYEFCARHAVPHRRCGKLIVAIDDVQLSALVNIKASAASCGVDDLQLIGAAEIERLEPDLACAGAILSPSTGIVDSHAYMQALLGVAETNGATLVCRTEVSVITRSPKGWAIGIAGSDAAAATGRTIVNAAGLGAIRLAHRIENFPETQIPALHLAKGNYFSYAGSTRFRHLIYPLPEPGGLGTHLTLDMAGRARFGPDVEWIDEIDYAVDAGRRRRFAEAIRRFWPAVDAGALQPDYAGIRPKLSGPGAPAADFVIAGPRSHGIEGIVNLFGIESPGITASLAIAGLVRDEIAELA